jgi:hypothetical protein
MTAASDHTNLNAYLFRSSSTALSCQLFQKMGKKFRRGENLERNCVPISIRLTIINIAGLSFSRAPLQPSPSGDVTPGAGRACACVAVAPPCPQKPRHHRVARARVNVGELRGTKPMGSSTSEGNSHSPRRG